ncbi:MAG TPA: hypothetical protein VKV05_13735 [Terriglobales bacterium]|nr:hypothetical protein [Terriglobales bacterium]
MSRRILSVLVAAMLAVTTAAPVFAAPAHLKHKPIRTGAKQMQMAANSSVSKTRHQKSSAKTSTHQTKAGSAQTTKRKK